MAYTKYSLTPANNNAAPPDGAPEGMLPSAVNDTMRDMMAQIRDCGDGIRGGAYTMTAPVITGGSINGTTTITTSGAISYTGTLTGGTGVVNIGSGQFYKDASGNVGIDTSSPGGKLDVVGASNTNSAARTVLYVRDTTAFGAGVGPGISFFPKYNSAGTYFDAANIKGIKEDGTDGTFAGAMVFSTGQGGGSPTERMRIDSSGNLLVGTTTNSIAGTTLSSKGIGQSADYSGTYAQAINSSSTTGNQLFVAFGRGGSSCGYIISTGTNSTSFGTSSDYRLKENIAPMTGALAKVQALKPVTYKWKVDGSDGQGFIAHELQEIVPEAVIGEKDAMRIEKYEITPAIPATFDEEGNELTPAVETVMGEREVPAYQGIDTSFLVATLTAAIQEQQAMINELKAKVAALEAA